eukprot:6454841-Amphidinium_carterae.2
MRSMLKGHARHLLTSNKAILDGRSLGFHLRRLCISEEAFIGRLHGQRKRWGNTLDIAVAADLWSQRLQVVDMERPGSPVIADTGGGMAPLIIGYARSHFFVVKRRSHRPRAAQRTWGILPVFTGVRQKLAELATTVPQWRAGGMRGRADPVSRAGGVEEHYIGDSDSDCGDDLGRDAFFFFDDRSCHEDLLIHGDGGEVDEEYLDWVNPYSICGKSLDDHSSHTIRSRVSLQDMTYSYVRGLAGPVVQLPVAPSYDRIEPEDKRPFLRHVLRSIHSHLRSVEAATGMRTPRVCPPNSPMSTRSWTTSLEVESAASDPSTPGAYLAAYFNSVSGDSSVVEGFDRFTGLMGPRSEEASSPGDCTPGPHHLGERAWSNPASLRPMAYEFYVQAMQDFFADVDVDSPPIFHENGTLGLTEKLLLLHQQAQFIAQDPVFGFVAFLTNKHHTLRKVTMTERFVKGAVRRRYSLAAANGVEDNVIQLRPRPMTLVYHGSFGPFHPGHKAGLFAAMAYLRLQGVQILRAVIGCTTADQLEKKVADKAFADVALRVKIIEQVMNEGVQADFPFVIDPQGKRTSFLLASAHLENELDAIYLHGTDVQKHPSTRSIVATRSDNELATRGEYIDLSNMSAVCIQRDTLNVSSTSLRAIMRRGKIPGVYGPKARALINPVVWRMQKALKGTQAEAIQVDISRKRAGAEAGIKSDQTSSKAKKVTQASSSELVLEKAMPVKARCKTAAVSAPVKATPSPAVASGTATSHQTCRDAGSAQAQAVLVQKELHNIDPQSMVSEKANLLKKPGVLKLTKPIFSNLAVFWANCVLPVCALLRIQPYLMTRRNGDEAIRVAYRPTMNSGHVLCVRLDVESFRDFRLALVQVGGQLVTLWYIAFDFVGLEDADLDRDTHRGMALLSLLKLAVTHLNKVFELASTPVAFFMADVQQLVVVSRPCYQVEPSDAAVDMQQILNLFFFTHKDMTFQYGASNPLCLNADPARCRWFRQGGGTDCARQCSLTSLPLTPFMVFLQGGMQRGATGRSSRSRSRSREAAEPVLEDTVADLYFAHWKTPSDESVGQQRTVHVSVDDKLPVTITVPVTWSTQDVQWMLARHLGLREGWLDFTWVQSDVHVARSTICPILTEADKLLACGDSLPRKALTMNTFTNKLELSMGCCLHSKGRINAFSQTHGELVRALANVVTDMVPDVVFNAMLLVVTPQQEREPQENHLFSCHSA